MNRKLWLLMTWLLVVPAFVQAASVRGVVVDYETNKPIANVKVAIRNVSAVTDFDGNFELKKVRAGSVVVVFTAADYKAYSVDFVVNDGVNTLNASLQPKKVDNTLNQQALDRHKEFIKSYINLFPGFSDKSQIFIGRLRTRLKSVKLFIRNVIDNGIGLYQISIITLSE